MASNFKAQLDDFTTREAWLKAAEAIMAQWIEIEGYEYPLNTRIACGFPKSFKGRGKAIGQCWTKDVSGDLHFEIFLSPEMGDPAFVCAVLLHEMVHATVGIEAGHGERFGKLARQLGLEGKLTSTVAGADLEELIKDRVLATLGKYPHAQLRAGDSGVKAPKKGKTYLVKATCPDCGYIAYTTQKWLDIGIPHCPDHGEMEL